MIKKFLRLIAPPHFKDEEANRIAGFLNVVLVILIPAAVAISVIDALDGIYITGIILLPSAFALMVTRWFVFEGRLRVASVLLLAILIVVLTFLLLTGQGLHDIGLPLFPVIILIAALLLDRRDYFFVIVLVVCSLAFINLGELTGIFKTKDLYPPRFADLVIICIILALAAIGLRVMAENLTSSVRRARENEHDLAIANEELRKKAQLIEMSEARWRSVVHNAPVAILSIVMDGTVTFSNQFDEEGGDMYVGKTIYDFMPADEHANARKTVTQVYETGKPDSMENRILTPAGRLHWFRIELGPVLSPDGTVNSLIVLAEDIHARKMAVEALQVSEKNLRERAYQLATLNRIGQSLAKLHDVHGGLMDVVSELKEIIPLDAFFVSLYDAETKLISYPLFYEDGKVWNEPTAELNQKDWVAGVIQSGKPYILHRTPEEIEFRKIEIETDDDLMLGEKSNVSASVIIAPLNAGEKIIGAVSLHSYELNAYTNDHVELLTGAANQIAIAIENARLYGALSASQEATSRRAEQLAMLLQIGTTLSTLQNMHGALTLTFEQIKTIVPLDVFYIGLYDAETKMVSFPIYYESGTMSDEQPSPISETSWAKQVIKTGSPFVFHLTAEEFEQHKNKKKKKSRKAKTVEATKISASVMMAPLRIGTKTIGVISTHSYSLNAYNQELLSLLSGVGNQVAIAIENARLYEALNKELGERRRAEREVRNLNEELEHRVRQRTAELETANRELEAYSYTVSHDLRAPLRAIHGFSRILANDFAGELSPIVQNYLKRINENSIQMGNLIDDLLAFSRLGRKPINKESVALNLIVQKVFDELTQHEENKDRINFCLEELGMVQADPALIKQVFVNLISNAIKFSRRNEIARIEVGCEDGNGTITYYVRDDGAGFDMAHASKLFQVFTRLHSYEEFEGTGVGLAIVQRIIEKHGGRIWAKAEIDQGAAFYFTLG